MQYSELSACTEEAFAEKDKSGGRVGRKGNTQREQMIRRTLWTRNKSGNLNNQFRSLYSTVSSGPSVLA